MHSILKRISTNMLVEMLWLVYHQLVITNSSMKSESYQILPEDNVSSETQQQKGFKCKVQRPVGDAICANICLWFQPNRRTVSVLFQGVSQTGGNVMLWQRSSLPALSSLPQLTPTSDTSALRSSSHSCVCGEYITVTLTCVTPTLISI